ncbi:MAG: TIGR01906 family membrane protein [Muricoprocola sp.]
MKWKRTVQDLLLAVICFCFLVSFAVVGTLAFRPLYYRDIQALHISEVSGYSEEEIRANYDEVIDYELFPSHKELNLVGMPMSEEARIHFQEVKEIFGFFEKMLVMTFFLGTVGIVWQHRKHHDAYLRLAGEISVVIPAVLGVLMAFRWDWLFDTFHELMFSNDYWLFNPVTDPIINILPDEFFLHCGCMILGIILAGAVVFFSLSGIKKEGK